MSDRVLQYDGQTAVVTGAGAGLGRAYAIFFASRGASVVVNDLGGGPTGTGRQNNAADETVRIIRENGGQAVADYNNVIDGERIIDTAIRTFGSVDILVNNAGILRDISFKNMTDQDWDLIINVHVIGAYKCTRAAFPYMREKRYGRIINTASAAGLFGSFGQTNYSAAKLALVGFTESLAKEGLRYNILCNTIAPIAASRLTATVLPQEVLDRLQPEWIVPLVGYLTHGSSTTSGGIFEVGGGHVAQLRWERSRGAFFKPDATFSAAVLLRRWREISDFSEPEWPNGPADFQSILKHSLAVNSNGSEGSIATDFKGRVAIVTGGSSGIGRAYCLHFAKFGARVVVNDLIDPTNVVEEIRTAGGDAIGVACSVEDGQKVVQAAIDAYGRVDIVVNNAGILQDAFFHKMKDQQFTDLLNVHLRGSYKITKAAWPYMVKQKFGRVVNTTSTSGIYGNLGQANYAAAKCGILGFSRALALEGKKYNINVNTIAPYAGTGLSKGVLTEELYNGFKPEYLCPLISLLCSDNLLPEPATGRLFESGGGWVAETRWQRSGGVGFPVDRELTPEMIRSEWASITNVDDGRADNPHTPADGTAKIMANSSAQKSATSGNTSGYYLEKIAQAQEATALGTKYAYDDKDVILYNLGLGAKERDLSLIYEGHKSFQVLPSFGVIPPFFAKTPFDISRLVPNFKWTMLLHGEQYLEIRKFPIPTHATTISYPSLVDVVDKGKAAAITTGCTVKDSSTGDDLFYTETLVYVRGAGGFGGARWSKDRGTSTRSYNRPKREPDHVVQETTSRLQAAVYRLSGDRNPLHIDPGFSKQGGFDAPILHGLCFFGIAAKAVLETYGQYRNIKVRFVGTVLPGETIVTEMWKEGNLVLFQAKVKESGELCISGGGAELIGARDARL